MTYYSRYRHLAIKRARPPPTETQLAVIETFLGAHLPASFRDLVIPYCHRMGLEGDAWTAA